MFGLATLWDWVVPYLSVVAIVVITIVVAWVVSLIIGRLMRQSTPQMVGTARRLGVVVVGVIGGTLVLQAVGLNPTVILLVIGLLGVTVLVALREPLSNYGAKYFSDIYTPFKVGDTILVQGVSGKVIEINPMTTVLLSDSDQLISVPNVAMIRDVVVNTSPQAWKEVVIPVSLGATLDLPAFESDLLKSLAKLRMRLDPRFPPVLTTKSRTAQSTDLVLTLMLRYPEDRDPITVEVNKRLTEVLERLRGGMLRSTPARKAEG
jgi:small-conductance mechanosensitive channel